MDVKMRYKKENQSKKEISYKYTHKERERYKMSECINKVIGYLRERMVLLKILFKDWQTKIEVK